MGMFDKVKRKIDESPIGTVGHNITDKYNDLTGIADVREAQDKYDKKVSENTGEAGMRKAAMQGQIGATSVGANAAETAKTAASSAGASKGAASALGEGVLSSATNDAVAGETQKAAQKNQEEVTKAGKDLEAATADMNARADIIGKGATLIGTGIGTAIGGPLGGMVGGALGGLGATGVNYANQRAASDCRLKDIFPGYQSKIKRPELLHLLDELNSREMKDE